MKTTLTPRFAVLIAAYNEADSIQDTVTAAAALPGVAGVIVVDDGSVDDTASKACGAGALVVQSEHNGGKGQALELAATTLHARQPFGALDGVVLLDGDVDKSASAASALLEPLAAGTADLVIGILPSPPNKAGFGLVKKLAYNSILEHGRGFKAQAPLSGQRALTLDCLDKVRPFANGYAVEIAMTISALQQGLRVMEVPVEMTHRHTGRNISGFLHRGRQFLQINRHIKLHYKK